MACSRMEFAKLVWRRFVDEQKASLHRFVSSVEGLFVKDEKDSSVVFNSEGPRGSPCGTSEDVEGWGRRVLPADRRRKRNGMGKAGRSSQRKSGGCGSCD